MAAACVDASGLVHIPSETDHIKGCATSNFINKSEIKRVLFHQMRRAVGWTVLFWDKCSAEVKRYFKLIESLEQAARTKQKIKRFGGPMYNY